MAINALAYIGVRSDNLPDWKDFAGQLLGMQVIDRGGTSMAFRMDDKMQRLVVSNEPGETLAFMGWQTESKNDLIWYAEQLEASNIKVEMGNRALADRRFVDDLIVFNDPVGNRVEVVYNPHVSEEPFEPGRNIEGFKTGPFGLGHAVLNVPNAEKLMFFYRDILGFSVSDFGLSPLPIYFFHVNGRHHSFAILESGKLGFHHFMVEYNNLDDVGQGYDLAQLKQNGVAYTLGRHTNDYMTSFYANSPSGFFVENGWGGRIIDPFTWVPHETTVGPSFWGHERLHLPEEKRAKFREMRLKAAEKGIRAPSLPDCPWLYKATLRS